MIDVSTYPHVEVEVLEAGHTVFLHVGDKRTLLNRKEALQVVEALVTALERLDDKRG